MALKEIIEALIFAADEPLTVAQIKQFTNSKGSEEIREALRDMQAEYETSGIQMVRVGGGYQFRSHPDYANWVRKMRAVRAPRLTRAMLETLAIVAYRQPVTRPEIEEIRGVDSGSTIRVLLERHLIRIVGKKEEPGRTILYGSTRFFLEFFNLKDLKDLPTLKEFTELNEENAEEVELKYGTAEEAEEAVRAARGEGGEGPGEGEGSEEEVTLQQMAARARARADEQAEDERRLDEEDDKVLGSVDEAMGNVGSVLRQHKVQEEELRAAEEARVREKLGLTSLEGLEGDDVAPAESSGSEPAAVPGEEEQE